jgi:hypothetical protein
MAPVYLPQPYPVLPVEYAPVAPPMPVMQMSPQPAGKLLHLRSKTRKRAQTD